MNVLTLHRPWLANYFHGSQFEINPFYRDENLWAAVEYVRKNW